MNEMAHIELTQGGSERRHEHMVKLMQCSNIITRLENTSGFNERR